jgi:hypothetical protein
MIAQHRPRCRDFHPRDGVVLTGNGRCICCLEFALWKFPFVWLNVEIYSHDASTPQPASWTEQFVIEVLLSIFFESFIMLSKLSIYLTVLPLAVQQAKSALNVDPNTCAPYLATMQYTIYKRGHGDSLCSSHPHWKHLLSPISGDRTWCCISYLWYLLQDG